MKILIQKTNGKEIELSGVASIQIMESGPVELRRCNHPHNDSATFFAFSINGFDDPLMRISVADETAPVESSAKKPAILIG